MRFDIPLFSVITISIFLAGCGGGDNHNAYDGTWAAVYPALSQQSTITNTQAVICNTPPATLIIKNSAGSTTQTATCDTFIITSASGVPPTETLVGTQATAAYISVSIEPSPVSGQKDVLNAIVNGVPHTGQCISNNACSAVSAAGDTLGLTR